MAYSDEQWARAKGYYEAGLSLSQIKDKTGIARNTISQRAKREQWEQGRNAEYIEAREIVAVKKGTILEQSGTVALQIAEEVADDNIRRRNLIYGNAEKLARKLNTMTDHIDKPDELKQLAEANDKLAVTLKVADRHAPKGDVNVQTNVQQISKIERHIVDAED